MSHKRKVIDEEELSDAFDSDSSNSSSEEEGKKTSAPPPTPPKKKHKAVEVTQEMLKKFRVEVAEQLKPLCAKFGLIKFDIGHINYSAQRFSGTFHAYARTEEDLSPAQIDWNTYCGRYDLQREHFGAKVEVEGKGTFYISGLKTKNRRYPILLSNGKGRTLKAPLAHVKKMLALASWKPLVAPEDVPYRPDLMRSIKYCNAPGCDNKLVKCDASVIPGDPDHVLCWETKQKWRKYVDPRIKDITLYFCPSCSAPTGAALASAANVVAKTN